MGLKTSLRMVARDLYKTWTLKLLYPRAYQKAVEHTPVKEKKVVLLEVRQKELSDSFICIRDALIKKGYEVCPVCIQEGTVSRQKVRANCIKAAEDIADAKWILINDSCYFLSSIPLREETKVIQLWHACGAFKRFGYSLGDRKFGANTKELDRFPVHRNFSYVTVSSPEVVWAYAEAFHMDKEKVLPLGISRTDLFFDPEALRRARQKVQAVLKENGIDIEGKKILLYAPTFRGRVADAVSPDVLDYEMLHGRLGDDWVFLAKHHPFVKKPPKISEKAKAYALDVTSFLPIEVLLMVSDVCISDYSSLIFEYSLFERPMLFLAYDLQDYNDWRGFYYSYEEMTPGPVLSATEEVCEYLLDLEHRWDKEQLRAFRQRFMSSCDGHATERILALMEKEG